MRGFKVQLDAYHGPLDLLLYLVRKDEVEIAELPLADVTEQYLEQVVVLERIDADAAGEFLDVASQLVELKSLRVLPVAEETADPERPEDEIESPSDLVERLLDYKRHRDAAEKLEALRLDWSRRYTRPADAPPPRRAPDARRVERVEVWDLVAAFASVLRRHEKRRAAQAQQTLRNDETPIHVYLQRIDKRVRDASGPVAFVELFPDANVPKATLIAVFVALMELIRYGHVEARQAERFGPILLGPGAVPYSGAVRSDGPERLQSAA